MTLPTQLNPPHCLCCGTYWITHDQQKECQPYVTKLRLSCQLQSSLHTPSVPPYSDPTALCTVTPVTPSIALKILTKFLPWKTAMTAPQKPEASTLQSTTASPSPPSAPPPATLAQGP